MINVNKKKFAPESRRKMKGVLNLCSEWRNNRITNGTVCDAILKLNLEDVSSFTESDLVSCLSYFVREIKKLDGNEYPPNTILEMIIMIQMHLNEDGIFWKLLDGEKFIQLKNVIDNTMKESHGKS